MVHNVERHGDNDQYSNGKLAKYKKMIEDSKKLFYHGCADSVHEIVYDIETFPVEGEQRME
jgi:hypothetical protein